MLALEYDKRRMEVSIAVAVIFWALVFLLLAMIRIREAPIPEDSMNPVFVELVLPEQKQEPLPPRRAGGTESSAPAAVSGAERSSPGPGQAAPPQAAPSPQPLSPGGASDSSSPSVPALRPDPGSAPLPSQARAPSAYQGGADPFSPLQEDSLRSAELPAPADTNAPAARSQAETGRRSTAPGALPGTDDFSRSLGETERKLAAGGSAAGTGAGSSAVGQAGTGSSQQVPGGGASAPGGGDLAGNFDFGDGIARELWTPRRIRIPDRLLAGQPDTITTRVSFTIEAGGSVLLNTIRFEPPLPQGLDEFMRTFFGAWQFTPADSDGQVRFQYSIKVR